MNMKITISRDTLLPALARACSVASKKNTMPICECALLVADATGLRVAATDLFSSVSQVLPCDTDKNGSIGLPAKDLLERIKAMPAGPLSLAVDKGVMTITAKGSKRKFRLQGMPADDFPAIEEMPGTADLLEVIPTETLSLLIDQTKFAVSTDKSRAHLNGANLEFDGGNLRVVATDGYRLSMAQAQVNAQASGRSAIVPQRTLEAWARALSDKTAPKTVTFAQQGPVLFLRVGEVDFSAKSYDAQFPPWERILPPRGDDAVTNREELIAALRAVRLSSSAVDGAVVLDFGQTLKISAESPSAGYANDEVSADYPGAAVSVRLNAEFLLQSLEALYCDEVAISPGKGLDPVLVVPAKVSSSDRSATKMVVMPVMK
jgi:DNA polymerase III subunit beta